jgi:hypothetical protein
VTESDVSQAGAAFARALESDAEARSCWERARARLRSFAELRTAMLRAGDREAVLEELAAAIRDALIATDRELEAAGFEAPTTLEDWEHLAHIAEMPFDTIRSGDLTLADVRTVALAWADRQRMKARLAAQAGASQPEIHGGPDDDDRSPPALTGNEASVLRTLAIFDPAELASAARVEAAMDRAERISDKTIRVAIRRLVELGLAERPEGDRSGARLTIAGRRLVRKIAD